jgi:hypothetical protein
MASDLALSISSCFAPYASMDSDCDFVVWTCVLVRIDFGFRRHDWRMLDHHFILVLTFVDVLNVFFSIMIGAMSLGNAGPNITYTH